MPIKPTYALAFDAEAESSYYLLRIGLIIFLEVHSRLLDQRMEASVG